MADRLGLKEAREIVDAMSKAATEKGLKFSAAVVDAGGRAHCFAFAVAYIRRYEYTVRWLTQFKAAGGGSGLATRERLVRCCPNS